MIARTVSARARTGWRADQVSTAPRKTDGHDQAQIENQHHAKATEQFFASLGALAHLEQGAVGQAH
jgi:type II secretory pathway component PulK